MTNVTSRLVSFVSLLSSDGSQFPGPPRQGLEATPSLPGPMLPTVCPVQLTLSSSVPAFAPPVQLSASNPIAISTPSRRQVPAFSLSLHQQRNPTQADLPRRATHVHVHVASLPQRTSVPFVLSLPASDPLSSIVLPGEAGLIRNGGSAAMRMRCPSWPPATRTWPRRTLLGTDLAPFDCVCRKTGSGRDCLTVD